MANRTIFTTPVRCSFPHLDQPHAQNPQDEPKYSLTMMAPTATGRFRGLCHINNQPSNFDNIRAALDEVCMEEWGYTFAQSTAAGMGVNYPPQFKDGNTVFEKDNAGNPIPNKISPYTADMEMLSVKNVDPIGCVDHTGQNDINPKAIYGGCWVACQLEVSAYTGNHGRVIVVKLINVQMCYNDESFGGKAPSQSAKEAFGNRAVADSNVEAGYGQQFGQTPQAGSAPAANAAPTAPQATPTAPAEKKLVMIATDFTYEVYKSNGWDDDTLVANGKAKWEEVPAAAPQAPSAPSSPSAPPQAPAQANAAPQAPQAAPSAPAAPQAPSAPAAEQPKVIMNAGEASYESHIEMGWTDDMLIQHGKAKPNYLEPA